jgi:hypothetical protein
MVKSEKNGLQKHNAYLRHAYQMLIKIFYPTPMAWQAIISSYGAEEIFV